jgi:purine nucleosidase
MEKKPVFIDTDIGLGTPGAEIDDGAAIIMMLQGDRVDVVGMGSVYGNVPLKDAAKNLNRLAAMLGHEDIAFGIGSDAPLVGDMAWFDPWMSEYSATLPWNPRISAEKAGDLIVCMANEYRGKLTILSIGPMTNLAEALKADPRIVKMVSEVVVMGGSFSGENAAPEFNLKCDPDAAQVVLNAGWQVTAFGLDVTRRVLFAHEMFHGLTNGNPAVQLLKSSADGWIDRVEAMGWESGGCSLHDAVAAAYIIEPSLFKFTSSDIIMVDLSEGIGKGISSIKQTQGDSGKIRLAVDVDENACRDLIWSRING